MRMCELLWSVLNREAGADDTTERARVQYCSPNVVSPVFTPSLVCQEDAYNGN